MMWSGGIVFVFGRVDTARVGNGLVSLVGGR